MGSEFDRFVGIPYADKGRGEAVDCWGLVCRVFSELRGIELPSYAEHYVTAADRRSIAALIAGELDPWLPVVDGEEQPFDCVLMKECGFPRHIGIVTRPGMLLHVQRAETSMIERYRSGPLYHRVVGIYRFMRDGE
ncbi:tail assembly protein [Bradyrhizobium japonicum]|uniref:Tail assembly protein n=1 Tax=Bradyrhizobium japonicum TaxID=375 RepID=A0A0A3XR77_BRAJP|nr:NlpC/P60 family protein [Bradyrhizobium japonicum]KGT75789.1 tail assembly protein [Bradyrhizobium japonicum]